MLEIEMENKKGILYVRLTGELSKRTIEKWNSAVKKLIIDTETNKVVFNMSHLTKIDNKGISSLYYGYELCKDNNGSSIICGIDPKIREIFNRSRLLKYMKESNDEFDASLLLA